MRTGATVTPSAPTPADGAAAGKIAFAHVLRGWAALSVLVGHLALSFWANPAAIAALTKVPEPAPMSQPPAFTRAWTSAFEMMPGVAGLFSPGPFGVGLFFLISGFVIPFSFRKQSKTGFLVGRVVRLWPTYAAGLTVTLVAVWAGTAAFGVPFPYSFRHVLAHYVLGLRDLLWLPSIDGVVWTLEIEVKFYVLCALLSSWLVAGRRAVLYFVPALLFVTVCLLGMRRDEWLSQWPEAYRLGWVGAVDSQMMLFMFAGTAFNFLHRGLIGKVEAAAVIVSLYGLSAWSGFLGYAQASAVVVACSHGAALVLFAAGFALRDRIRGGGVAGWFADISYPLYAVHAVAGYVLMSVLTSRGLPGGITLVAALALAIGLAWLVHVTIEKPTHRLASRVAYALSPKPVEPARPTLTRAA